MARIRPQGATLAREGIGFGLNLLSAKVIKYEGNGDKGYLGFDTFDNVSLFDGGTELITLIDPLISCRLPNNIVITELERHPGSVKEWISPGDADIMLSGKISRYLGDENELSYPDEDVRKLVQARSLGKSLKVASDTLERFGVANIVIQEIDFPPVAGAMGEQDYVITCISDTTIELDLSV